MALENKKPMHGKPAFKRHPQNFTMEFCRKQLFADKKLSSKVHAVA